MRYWYLLIALWNIPALAGQIKLIIEDHCAAGQTVIIGIRVGEKIYSKDTLVKGINKIDLTPGMYALVRSGTLIGDVLLAREEQVSLELNCESISHLDSPVNSTFFSFVNAKDSSKQAIYERAEGAAKDVLNWCYPQLLVSKITDTQKTNSELNSIFISNLLESEDFIFNSPFFEINMEYYLANWINQDSDTLVKYLKNFEHVLEGDNKSYYLRFVLHRFESSKILGHENVFIDLALRNIVKQHVLFDSVTDANILNKAKLLFPNRIGQRVSDFNMRTPGGTGTESFLSSTGLYKLIFFFDPDCHHCKEAFPLIVDFARTHADAGVHVYAMATSIDLEEYQSFISEQPKLSNLHYRWDPVLASTTFRDHFYIPSTPTIYLTTATGTCLARGIAASELKTLFGHIINN